MQKQLWGLEEDVLNNILGATIAQFTTTTLDDRDYQSHEKIDCHKFPKIVIHVRRAQQHFLIDSLSAELFIKFDGSCNPVRLVGNVRASQKDEGEQFRTVVFDVAFVEERKGFRIIKTTKISHEH